MSNTTKRKTTRKKMTLSQFKAWLDGVEELHPKDWSPDADQWKLIRAKIKMVEEAPPPAAPPSAIHPQQHPTGGFVPTTPTALPESALSESAFSGGALPMAPPPNIPVPDMTPAAAAALSGKLPTEMVPSPDGKLKTPNIDTSSGEYSSSFT